MKPKFGNYLYLALLLLPSAAESAPNCTMWLAKVTSVQGHVDIQPFGRNDWQAVYKDDLFCPGDKIRTLKWSRSTLLLSNDSVVTLDQNTTLIFPEPEERPTVSGHWLLNLIRGTSFFRSRDIERLDVNTPFINAVHEGTEFMVAVDADKTTISVFDGRVAGQNPQGRIDIEKGFAGIAPKGRPPFVQPLKIMLEDAVQWTLYYPPLFTSGSLPAKSLSHYQKRNPIDVLNEMEHVTPVERTPAYFIAKASLLLWVGRLDEAEPIIRQVLQDNPKNSDAYALQSIVAVAKNHPDLALQYAQKAILLNPQSPEAYIALSYARQALFDLNAALTAAQTTVRLNPDNALGWARVSELQLSEGDRGAALIAAQKAQTLAADLGRTQTVLGFASLAQVDIETAKTAFNQAIALDNSDPLARLGLGLANIRQGHIEDGKTELETAVNLDPNNAIMRSYLGKAFYELKNKDYAGTELNLAKQMDPKDPTPWFYDAILKQTTNRPVEALHDMQKAIELNDNRRIYRSKLLLDQDAAARTANLARIYTDLGFGRVALKEAWKSLGYDSTSPSAHRFLSDAYIGQPRYRVARASELLQAQLLQPINITPVQPQLTAENIGILNTTGPANLSTSEYDPLYTSNGAHIVLNGAYGSRNTKTDNAIISGVYDNLSMSLGQFHYQTDGFRVNDDYKQDVYDAFAQYAISPDLSLQVEFKSDDVRAGDTPFRLNGFEQQNFRQIIEHDTARVGGHYKISPEQDLIASFFYTTRKDNTITKRTVIRPPNPLNDIDRAETLNIETDGHQSEIQYLFHPKYFDITTGLGYLRLSDNIIRDNSSLFFRRIPPTISTNPLLTNSTQQQFETNYWNSYIYAKQYLVSNLSTTLGISFDSYDDGLFNKHQFNPKFGIIWNPIKNLTIRSAAFRTLKRPLAANQTIEPSQVVGFNQLFDDYNGTTAWRYAFGFDFNPIDSFYLGGEVSWRDSIQPLLINNSSDTQHRNESSHIAYIYWAPSDWFSFNSEYRFDNFKRDFTDTNFDQINPQSVLTHQVPIAVNFFHKSGFFAKIIGTYVNQHAASVKTTSGLDYSSENFWSFDTSIGYRLPKKVGVISFDVKNLLNSHFTYQSTFDAAGPQLSPFIPELQLFARLSLFY